MPSGSAFLGFGGGFASGLSQGLLLRRQKQQQDQQRKEQHALTAVKLLMDSGQINDVADIEPLLGVAMPDVFGEEAQKGAKGKKGGIDGPGVVKHILQQAIQGHQAQPLLPGPAAVQPATNSPNPASFEGPIDQAPLPSSPVALPATAPARRTLFGIPLQSRQEVADQKLKQEIGGEGAKITAKIDLARNRVLPALQMVDKTATLEDALVAVGVKQPTTHLFNPHAIGGPVPAKDVPVGALGADGKPVDSSTSDLWQTVIGKDGSEYYTPGANKPVKPTSKPLTGAAGEAVNEALMAKGLDPRVIEPDSAEYHAAVGAAAQMLAKRRQLDDTSRATMIALRDWTLGLGTGSPASGGAAPGPAGTGAPGTGGGTPQPTLSALSADEQDEAKRIAAYAQPLNTRAMSTPRMDKVMRAVREINPSFDATQYQTRQRARIGFTTGKQGDNVRSLNTALGHMGTLADKAVALENADPKFWNSIANTTLDQSGDPRVKGFRTAALAVSNELTNLFRGGVGSEDDIKAWQEQLNAANSPGQLAEVMTTAADLVKSRQSALETQWKSAMGDAPFEFLSQDALKGLAKVDVQARKLRGSAGTSTVDPALRLKARQLLQSKGLQTDDATVQQFLSKPANVEALKTWSPAK